jgi:hypothetical protein
MRPRAWLSSLVVLVAVVLTVATAAASSNKALTPSYGGIGATLGNFEADHQDAAGEPPKGTTYYRVGETRRGRVWVYHVTVGWTQKRSASQLLVRLTGKQLPADAVAVKPYNGYCAVYRSRWLGRVIGLPYIVVYVPEHQRWWTNGATASRAPVCRG